MKFILFVEGYTERIAVPAFLKGWLDSRLDNPVGIKVVRFEGAAQLVKDTPDRARKYLNDPRSGDDVIGVIALLDLYGVQLPYPSDMTAAKDRCPWARAHLEEKVHHPGFRQFFAVHEIEAWLLSAPDIFPTAVKSDLRKIRHPESVDFDEPPAKLLERLYRLKFKRHYEKVTDGSNLFRRLCEIDASMVYDRCPYLKEMLDEMLRMAQEAGL